MVPQFATYATSLSIEWQLAPQRSARWSSLDGAVPSRRPSAMGGRGWSVARSLAWLGSMLRSVPSPRRLADLS